MVNFEYPLQWLPQQPRTKMRERARFGTHSPYSAGVELVAELERMGAKKCVISSNLQQRARGDGFVTNQRIDDPGIVVYFELKGKQKAMACDRWDRPEHNLWALSLSIAAIRGLERWGGSEFLDGLFTGFKALPAPEDVIPMGTPNYFADCINKDHVKETYRSLAKELHPDVGGSEAEFAELQRQYNQALSSFT